MTRTTPGTRDEPVRRTSIRRALLVGLLLPTALLLLAAAAFSYHTGLQEAGELFDAKLAHSSRVLMSLVDEPLAHLDDTADAPHEHTLLIRVWQGRASGVGTALARNDGHAYETKLAFQVRDPDGRLLLRSDSGPDEALAPLAPGFADRVIAGEHWRTFTLKAPSGRWYQSGELSAIREEIAEDIALGTLLPLLIVLPLIALLTWLVVRWASGNLERVSDAVTRRVPEHLEPIRLDRVPQEMQGLVQALNDLLERLRRELARQRRFTADAAHELRTPIAALRVHAYNVRHAANDDERAQSQDRLDAGIQRMELLVAQLLALSRIENAGAARTHVPVDLAALVRQHERDFAALDIAAGKRLHLDLAPAVVSGDASALDALARNLIDNALRYAPAGGEVRVRTARGDDGATVTVEDSGPGIPEAARERVFERFHRELGTGVEGSGLGLAIVAEALQQHGGRIVLDASPALGGLRATVTLPVG